MEQEDDRIEKITELFLAIASGNFKVKGEISDNRDELDSIIIGINMLGEELEATTVSRDYLESIYRGIVDMLIVLNPDNTVQKINPAVCNVLSYEEHELVGKDFSFLFGNYESEISYDEITSALNEKGHLHNIEWVFITKDGDSIPVSISSSLLYDKRNNITGTVHIAKDISLIKKTEKMLKSKNDALNTFVYKASHDLRGPLASMMGLVDLVKDEQSPDIKDHYIELIGRSAEKLNLVLTDLMEFTMISYSSLQLSKIDFRGLIEDIVSSLQHLPEFKATRIDLVENQTRSIKNDTKILRSILQNLIDNGVKYRNPDSEQSWVKISISDHTKGVVIDIMDNGKGMTEEVSSQVFNMFYRGDTGSKGSGLGLFIVQSSVEKLQGQISLVSSFGKGSTFSVFIPDLSDIDSKLEDSIDATA
ncbi:MAG: PAS domain-containing sensor histidine kinase [Bacteroidia bacterium]